jgi:uncharacterized protein
MRLVDVFELCQKTAAWENTAITSLMERNPLGDTPLHTACSWGELEPVKVLLENGADINARGDHGASVLFNAIIGGNPAVVGLLLRQGADPNIKNDWGRTPLQYAVNVSASLEIIKLLQVQRKSVVSRVSQNAKNGPRSS